MWSIQILWNDVWVTVQRGFKSRGDAEWATAKWKQKHGVTADPFRVYEEVEGFTAVVSIPLPAHAESVCPQ